MATDGNQVSVFVLELEQDYYEQRQNDILGVYTSLDKAIAAIDAHAAIQTKWVMHRTTKSPSYDKPVVYERHYDRKWPNIYSRHEQTDHYYACFIVYEMELA